MKKNPFVLNVSGGQIAYIHGHVSTTDDSIKNRKFQVSTHVRSRQIALEDQVFNGLNVLTVHATLVSRTSCNFPIYAVSKAIQNIQAKIENRKTGKTRGGPIETIPVAVDVNGRPVLRMVKNQKSGEWSLLLGPVEQMKTETIKEGTVDHEAEKKRKFHGSIERAWKQADKWIDNPDKQSLNALEALIRKVTPLPKAPQIRSFTLIGKGAIKCDSISIGGQRFTDMLSVVETFRPDLLGLLNQKEAVSV